MDKEIIKNLAKKQIVKTHHALGTAITLQLFGAEHDDNNLLTKTTALVDHYEDILTVNRDESEIMDVNHAAGKHPVQLSRASYQLVKLAVEESRLNYGFNALIGPLVKLWKIGFKGAHVPKDSEIKEKLALIDPMQVELNDLDQTVFLKQAGMELDLGGIAKGYIADRIRDLWRSEDGCGIINLGGNILLVGACPKRSNGQWTIGIQDPKKNRGDNITQVMVPECSAVTSGTYERYLIVNGKKYHHLIDPRTGYPVKTNLAGVTTFTQDSVRAELECKRLFFAGKPITGWSKRQGCLGAIFVYNDEKVVYDNF